VKAECVWNSSKRRGPLSCGRNKLLFHQGIGKKKDRNRREGGICQDRKERGPAQTYAEKVIENTGSGGGTEGKNSSGA